jgi:uncharacterized BrkB/YihY/UPF0761 family membrane protein
MNMWWKLGVLAAIESAAIGALFLPIKTHAVLYEPGSAVPPSVIAWQDAMDVGGLVLLIALTVPLWLAYRVIRNRRNSN